jgi:hypothetical protein
MGCVDKKLDLDSFLAGGSKEQGGKGVLPVSLVRHCKTGHFIVITEL